MKENKVKKDKAAFMLILIIVIALFGWEMISVTDNSIEQKISDEDFLWFAFCLVCIIISSLLFYLFILTPKIKYDDFDGGRFWLSLYQHKN